MPISDVVSGSSSGGFDPGLASGSGGGQYGESRGASGSGVNPYVPIPQGPQPIASNPAVAEDLNATPLPPGPRQLQGVGAFPSGAAGAGAVPAGPALAPMAGAGLPKGFYPTTRSTKTTQNLQYSPETLGAVGESLGARGEQTLAQYESDLAHGTAQRQADKALQASDQLDAIANQAATRHQLAALREYHAKTQAMMADAAKDKEDPAKWFKDQNAFGQIMTTLAMAVTGFGYGYTGRGTDVVQQVNQRMAQSIASQRAAHEKKRDEIGDRQNMYGMLKEQYGDDTKATLALQLAQRQALMAALQDHISDATAPQDARLRASQLHSALAADNEKTLRDLDHDQAQSVERQGAEVYRQNSGPAPIGVRVTLADGSSRVIPVAQAKELDLLPRAQLETRKLGAEVGKTEAEARKLDKESGAGAADTIDKIADDIKSTSFWTDPEARIGSAFQGTEGAAARNAQQRINTFAMGQMHKMYGARTPEAQEHLAEPYLIGPNDTPTTIAMKIRALRQDMLNKSSAPGEGAKAEEE